MREAIGFAQRYGTRLLNALAGVLPPGIPAEVAERIAVANLRAAAPLVARAGLTLLVEAINAIDIPGYFASTVEMAAKLVEGADSTSVRLQLDQYHAGMAGADARVALRAHFARIAHVQIADVPGRHQPGTGSQPIGAFLEGLDRLGYAGSVGLEYRPLGTTEESLAWLPRSRRG